MSERKHSDADVQRVIDAISYPTQEGTLNKMTKDWNAADFTYAIEYGWGSMPSDRREQICGLYRGLRAERISIEARIVAEAANQKRHAELASRLAELKKPHWTVNPNFWLTVVSAAAAVVAAYFGWLTVIK